jgi:hypothetical protein
MSREEIDTWGWPSVTMSVNGLDRRRRHRGARPWLDGPKPRCFEHLADGRLSPAILDGLGNMDEFTMEPASGRVQAITVRLYNPITGEWSLYRCPAPAAAGSTRRWSAGSKARVASSTPFIWAVKGPDSCRWGQAYSADGGKTWETNRIMEFVRQA